MAERDQGRERELERVADLVARATAGRPCAADSPAGLALFPLDERQSCGLSDDLRDVLAEARRCVIEGEPADPVVARLWLGLERVSTSGAYYRSRLTGRALAICEALRSSLSGGVKYWAENFVEVMEIGPKPLEAEALATPVLEGAWSELQHGVGLAPAGARGDRGGRS